MEDNVRKEIKKIFLKIFPTLSEGSFDYNKEQSSFENWDSLTHLQLISEVESVFRINFDMEEVVGVSKPEDLVSIVKKKKKNG